MALYSYGNSYFQITEMIEDIYGVGFSKGAISAVKDNASRMESTPIRGSISLCIS